MVQNYEPDLDYVPFIAALLFNKQVFLSHMLAEATGVTRETFILGGHGVTSLGLSSSNISPASEGAVL